MNGGRLDGKIIAITGTGGGQGRAAALLFAHQGASIVGCDVLADAAGETCQLVREAGGVMDSSHPIDLSDIDAATAWIDAAVATHGRIDVLYNNAASARGGPFGELTAEDWAYTLRHELDLVFNACRASWPHFMRNGGGSIINVASTAALVGSTISNAGHAAGKGGVLSLTRQLAVEGGPAGIRVNCVTPGSIASGAGALLADDLEFMSSYLPQTPLRRLGTPEDIALAALFFASEESAFVTGQNLVVDGGRTAAGFVNFADEA